MSAPRVISALVVALSALLAAWAIRADDAWFAVHWLPRQCYLDVTTRNEVLFARVVAALFAVALVIFVRPRVAKVAPSSWLGIGVAVVASLLVCEGVLRWSRRRHASPPPPPAINAYLRHDGRQSVDALIGGRTVHYETDENGFRVRDPSTRTDLSAPSILITGESVALGFGLDWDESPAGRLEQRMGMPVATLAVSGDSTAGTLSRLKLQLPKFEKPVALVTFVVHSWLERETDRRNWWVDWKDPALIPRAPEPSTESPLLQLWQATIRYHDDHRFDVARAAYKQIADLARSRSAKPLFVFTECGSRCRTQDFIAKELTRDLDAPYVWVDVPESDNLVGDIHPGPRSAIAYAAAIEHALREQGVQ